MKRKIISRGLLGIPIGIAIGYVISIIASLIWANGYYSPCSPELIASMENEIHAVVVQTLLCGLLGAGFAAASVIWEIEHWSLLKQSGIYFLIASFLLFPISYFLHWMERSILGFLIYLVIFLLLFIAIFAMQYLIWKYNVKKMNLNLKTPSSR